MLILEFYYDLSIADTTEIEGHANIAYSIYIRISIQYKPSTPDRFLNSDL